MKAITLPITKEVIEKFTTSSTGITGFKYNGKDVASCGVPNHLTSFPQLAISICSLLCRNNAGVDFKTITTATDKFTQINIKGTPENGEIFSIFRKFGILTGNLTIGLGGTPTEPVVFTTAKMLRDVSKFPADIQTALVAMMYNIAKICARIIYKAPKITLEPLTHTVNAEVNLTELVVNFDTIREITLAEIPTDNYKTVEYVFNQYCIPCNNYTGNISYNILNTISEEPTFTNAHAVSALCFGTVVYPIVICNNAHILTTAELTSFEAAKDSYFTALATLFKEHKVKVSKVTYEEIVAALPKECGMYNLSEDESLEELFINTAPATLVNWYTQTKKNTYEPLSEEVVKTITATFGFKTTSTTNTVDKEAMMEMYKDDMYAQQLYKQIKPYYDMFDLGTISANCRGFAKGDIYSMMFIGSSGTGKSTSARVLPTRCGIPYTSINFSVNIEESDIVGSMIPNVAKTKPEDPEFVWQDGILTKAVRNGYCIILEEINFARPGVLGKLNSLLDENRQIDLPTGEVVVAHPNFRIIATCNVAYEGTNRFNKALINRFEDCTIFKDVDRSAAIEIIKSRTGYKNMSKMDIILNVYEALKKYSKEQNLNLVISMRQLLNIFSNGKYYANALDAVVRIMVNGAFIEEPEYQEEFEKAILPAFKLNFKI